MTAPTPEQFLASPHDPEEDDEAVETPAPTPTVSGTAPKDSLASIATSLQQLVTAIEGPAQAQQQVAALDNMIEELSEQLEQRQRLIDRVLALIKPSTSKLANNLRAVLEPVVTAPKPPEGGQVEPNKAIHPQSQSGPTPDDDPRIEQPAHDADVEEWRAYARSLSPQVEVTGIDTANRSQIRTMLGIPQTEGGAS